MKEKKRREAEGYEIVKTEGDIDFKPSATLPLRNSFDPASLSNYKTAQPLHSSFNKKEDSSTPNKQPTQVQPRFYSKEKTGFQRETSPLDFQRYTKPDIRN